MIRVMTSAGTVVSVTSGTVVETVLVVEKVPLTARLDLNYSRLKARDSCFKAPLIRGSSTGFETDIPAALRTMALL